MSTDSTDKDTTVKNEDGKMTVPETDGKKTLGAPAQEDKRETADNIFENAAEEGRETAERNLAAEEKLNEGNTPGGENVTAKVTTSEAQPELKPAGDPENVRAKKVDARTGDDKAAQKADNAIKIGQATAKTNLKHEEDNAVETQEDGTAFEDAIEQGRKTAEKNHKAEMAQNKAANQR